MVIVPPLKPSPVATLVTVPLPPPVDPVATAVTLPYASRVIVSILVVLAVLPYVPEPAPAVAKLKVPDDVILQQVRPVPVATEVTPELVTNPALLLNILNPISLAAFLLSAPLSKTINSSEPTIF